MADPIFYDLVDKLYHEATDWMPSVIRDRDILLAPFFGYSGIRGVVKGLQGFLENFFEYHKKELIDIKLPKLERRSEKLDYIVKKSKKGLNKILSEQLKMKKNDKNRRKIMKFCEEVMEQALRNLDKSDREYIKSLEVKEQTLLQEERLPDMSLKIIAKPIEIPELSLCFIKPECSLLGKEGNVMAIIGAVHRTLEQADMIIDCYTEIDLAKVLHKKN